MAAWVIIARCASRTPRARGVLPVTAVHSA